MSDVLSRLGLWILKHPWKVSLVTLVLIGGCVLSLLRLRIDPNIEHLLPLEDPTLRLTRSLQGEQKDSRVFYVILRADDPRKLEDAVAAVAAEMKQSSNLLRVTSTRREFAGARVDWVQQSILHFVPEETLARLEARLTNPGRRAELEALQRRMAEDPLGGKATALADPLGLRWIFDEAAERLSQRFPAKLLPGSPYLIVEKPAVAFVKAIGREDASNIGFAQRLLADIRGRADRATAGMGVQVDLAGSYVSAVTQQRALRRDMIVESVVSTIAVMLYVWWFARSLLAAHLVFVPVVLAIAGSLALGGEIFGPLTPIVVSAAAILIAQGIDFPVHYFCRFRTERRDQGLIDALHRSQRAMTRPFIGIAATTMVAFLALLVSKFPGFRQFGFVLGAGIVLCLLAALALFPLLLMPVDRLVKPASERTPWIVRGAEAVLRTRWRVPLAWVLVVLGVVSWVWVSREGIRMDLDLRNAMAPGDPGRAVLEVLEKDLGTSLIPVYGLVDASMPLDELRGRVEALRKAGVIAAADGPADLVPTAAQRAQVEEFRRKTQGWVEATLGDLAKLGFKPGPFRKGLEEMEARFAAPAPGLDALDRPEFAAIRRTVRYESGGRVSHLVTMYSSTSIWRPDGRAPFDRTVRSVLGEGAALFSYFHLPNHYSEVLTADARKVVLITAAGIVLLTLMSVGNLREGLIALAPVVLATGMTLGAVVLMGGSINVINMAAIPIILAVGVDGGIHFMVRFRESATRDPVETIREVGPGIWGSAATTLLGFGSIATSWTPGMASMGYLVVVGTVTSVLASLFLLPGLLKGRTLPKP